jgi:hypothetical protein
MMDREGFGLIEELFRQSQGGTEENHENPVGIVGISGEIRTEHLQTHLAQ